MQKIALAVVAIGATAGLAVAEVPVLTSDQVAIPEQLGPRRPMPPPPPPTPAPEIAKLGKELAGTWTCNGTWLDHEGVAQATTGTITVELVLGDAWIRAAYALKVSGKPSRFVEHRSYDAIAKQWTRVVISSLSTYAITTSLGDDKGMWTWSGSDARDRERHTKDALELWTEHVAKSAWQRVSRLTCSR